MTRNRWAENLLLGLLVGFFVHQGFRPAWKNFNTDFRNYFVAARLYRHHIPLNRIYDLAWFHRQKDHAGLGRGVGTYIPLTLLSALPIAPLAEFSPLTAKRCWLVINAMLLALTALFLEGVTHLGWRRVLIVIFLALQPLRALFVEGQMHMLVLFFLALSLWLIRRGWPVAGGVSVALAAGLKIFPALFLAFFLRKKQWRALLGAAAGMAILAGLSIYLFGWEVHRTYLIQILPAMGRGDHIDPYAPGWNSATAFLHRALIGEPDLNPHPLLQAPALYAILQPLVQTAIFVPVVWLLTPGTIDAEHENFEWGAFAAMLLALSTVTGSYHLCLLILTATLALDSLLAMGQRKQAALVTAMYAITCLPWGHWPFHNADGWRMLLVFPRLYSLMALLALLNWNLFAQSGGKVRLRAHPQEAICFGCLFLVMSSAGTLQTFRHLGGLFENYSHRIFQHQGSLLNDEPIVGTQRLYFRLMRLQGMRVDSSDGEEIEPIPPATDEFHPATASGLGSIWVEQAGPISNIVRISILPANTHPSSQIEVNNGEQPSVSADGKWLAFVREIRGRGQLWIKPLAATYGPPSGDEREAVDDSYDVWEAAFEPGNRRLIFVAAPHGQPELFFLDLQTGNIYPAPIPGIARYPAFSPDGQWLAYSRCECGVWNVYATLLSTNAGQQVSHGDCNSISPTWEADSRTIIYATDCARGLALTALASIKLTLLAPKSVTPAPEVAQQNNGNRADCLKPRQLAGPRENMFLLLTQTAIDRFEAVESAVFPGSVQLLNRPRPSDDLRRAFKVMECRQPPLRVRERVHVTQVNLGAGNGHTPNLSGHFFQVGNVTDCK